MRVLQVNTEPTWRGGERQTLHTVRGLLDAGVEVGVLCRAKSPLLTRLRELPVTTFPVRSQREAVLTCARVARNYDLVHAQSAKGQGVAAIARVWHHRPLLYTRRVNFKLHGLSSRLKYSLTTRTIAISSAIQQTLAASGVKDVRVIPSAVDARPQDENRARLVLRTIGIGEGTKVIGTVGDLVPQKGPLLMVEVMRELVKLRDDTLLVQFGNDQMGPEVMAKIEEYGLEKKVKLLGFMDDVEDMFSAFDAYLVTGNATEGLNSSVFDAFVYRVPVVSTLTGGMLDSVGDRGLTAPDGDAPALAAHLHRLLDDPALVTTMTEKAASWAATHITLSAVTERYLAVYREDAGDYPMNGKHADGHANPTLTVVVMARDEELNIRDCLLSAEFADEVILVDTGSTDATRELAQDARALVIDLPWEGFGPTKAKSLALASSDWVLSLDADERIPPALAHEVLEHIRHAGADGYELPRRSFFLGHEMRHGGWDRDWVLRLVRRDSFRVTGDAVHERILVEGSVKRLYHPLDHHTNPTFSGYLAKVDLYSTLAAEKIAADHTRGSGIMAGVQHGFAAFFKKFVMQSGWRDGAFGALLAVSTGYEKFLRYVKAGLIRQGKSELVTRSRLLEVAADRVATRDRDKVHKPAGVE